MSQSLISNNKLTSDPYFKKDVFFRYREHNLNFRVSQSLFSSQDIDLGTKHLLKTLTDQRLVKFEKVLDLGCGYGPIGIALKTIHSSNEVHMVDKDALALEYSRRNAELNNVSGIKIYGSLGYDDVPDQDFDLIISNVPAKVGDHVLEYILKSARHYLRPGGQVAIVVINAIGDYVAKVLSSPDIKILFHKRWPGHLVYHYEFLPQTVSVNKRRLDAFELGVYDRGQKAISLFDADILIKATYNLPEFDTLNYETELLLKSLETIRGQNIERVVVFNPGQGFIPVALFKAVAVKQINLIDRDLQALKISQKNLILNGCSPSNVSISHQVGLQKIPPVLADCVLGILSDKDTANVHAMLVKEASQQLKKDGLLIIASNSTAITRITTLVVSEKLMNVLDRRKSKGKSSIILGGRK